MKIICIGRNYVAHAHELQNEVPTSPLIFMKPTTAILKNDEPFYHPEFSNDVHYEGELVIKISKTGKHIEEQFAHKYYEQITFGIDFTARDLQDELKKKGWPWELAKGFDGSAVIGNFISFSSLNKENIGFQTLLNGNIVQDGHSNLMIYNIDYIVSYVSKFFTLKQGDLIFTGTPAGVGKVKVGDKIEGFIAGEKLLECDVK